jgi:hypothetical protein
MTPFAKKCVMAPDDISTQEHSATCKSQNVLSKLNTRAAQFISNLYRHLLTDSSGNTIRKFIAQNKVSYARFAVYFDRQGITMPRAQYVFVPAKAYLKI